MDPFKAAARSRREAEWPWGLEGGFFRFFWSYELALYLVLVGLNAGNDQRHSRKHFFVISVVKGPHPDDLGGEDGFLVGPFLF